MRSIKQLLKDTNKLQFHVSFTPKNDNLEQTTNT